MYFFCQKKEGIVKKSQRKRNIEMEIRYKKKGVAAATPFSNTLMRL